MKNQMQRIGKAGRLFAGVSLLGVLLVSGCSAAKNNDNMDSIGVKTSPEGIKYKIVVIEGHKFVATQSAYNYWTLAGPIE